MHDAGSALRVRRARNRSLNINMDYCGTCRGNCPTCVLTASERAADLPFLSPSQVLPVIDSVASAFSGVRLDLFILGIGRGNTLSRPRSSVDDVEAMAKAADSAFDRADGCAEISTSMIGNLDRHLDRAKEIVDRFGEEEINLPPRFVIVGNPTIRHDKSYWDRIKTFIDTMAEYRGGGDGSGDVLVFNLALSNLPDIEWLESFVGGYKSPVNAVWTPVAESTDSLRRNLPEFEEWIHSFHDMGIRLEMDGNVLTRVACSRDASGLSIDSLVDHVEGNCAGLLFIDSTGSLHEGFNSVSIDMDPVRFGFSNGMMVDDARSEISRMLSWPSCRGCPAFGSCVASGAYKSGLMVMGRLDKKADKGICPSGMRKVLTEACT